MVITEAEIVPEIVRRLVAEFEPEQIFLFGSRAGDSQALTVITI